MRSWSSKILFHALFGMKCAPTKKQQNLRWAQTQNKNIKEENGKYETVQNVDRPFESLSTSVINECCILICEQRAQIICAVWFRTSTIMSRDEP